MSTSIAASTECHDHRYNKQALWPQAKRNISKLKSPNQYFHYLHYKLSINGSSLGKAPSFSPCTSECCSGLTAGTVGCMALGKVFSLEMAEKPAGSGLWKARREERKGAARPLFLFPLGTGGR